MKIERKPLLIGLSVLAVLTLAAAGIYWRITASAEASEADAAFAEGDATSGVAGTAFSTDMPTPVEGVAAVRDTLVVSVAAAGEAAAARSTVVRALVEGQVRTVGVREGQMVGQGGLLVALDPAQYRLDVEAAEASLAQAMARVREETLFDEEKIADPEIRAQRLEAARARSGADLAEIDLARAKLNLSRTATGAPFAGRVASVRVVPGQWVRAGDELVTIMDIDPIHVEVQVLESEVGYLEPGSEATVRFAAFPDVGFEGEIATVNPLVAGDTRTAKVTVLVPNPGGRILPGMYARVSLEAQEFADRILVPREAVLERDRRPMLFVYEEDENGVGRALWRYVTTGLRNDELVEIVADAETEMVEPGEVVLTGGHYTLIHDAPVRLVEDAAEAGGRPL
ncbi:MAG: efflux RND transporter periplasmic adaptor subunit [Longimicrobiales bacterium]